MSSPSEPRAVPALDLKAQYATIRGEIEAAVQRVLESQYFVLGPEVAAFEAEVATYCRTKYAVGCGSGSDALLLPLMAWGIGPGDEVITTPYTFFATAAAVSRVGAKPVFVDINPDDFNIDVDQIEAAITPRTKAIIPVHLYGQTAEMDRINTIALPRGIKVFEDAAQAIGALDNGRPAGILGDVAAFSFYPSKNLGAYGEGGLMTTNDEATARHLGRLRVHGMEPRYVHHEIGINSRLDALQAAVLRVKLRHLPSWTEARRAVAARYRMLFAEHSLTDRVALPIEREGCYHIYNQFVVRVSEQVRDSLRAFLNAHRIGTEIYYPIPLHLQKCFAGLGYHAGDFPQSELAARQTLALPIYPELSEADQRQVVATIAQFYEAAPRGSITHLPAPHLWKTRTPAESTRSNA